MNQPKKLPKISADLFSRMESSLKNAGADFEKSARIARTLAPILEDQSSNERHLNTINGSAPINEKVIAILMLGFPKNRQVLPHLKRVLDEGPDALRMAAAIAISQMRTRENQETLKDILVEAHKTASSADVKKTIKSALLVFIDKKTAHLVRDVYFSE